MPSLTLINGRFYTMDSRHPFAAGVVIQGGRIIRLLGDAEASQLEASQDVLDLAGRAVLPGLVDSHLHLQQIAESLQKIDCATASLQGCLAKVSAQVAHTPAGSWILGHGWNHNLWEEGFGNAQQLDRLTSQHPIYLTGKSLHVSWANSLALELAGIGTDTPDPSGGVIGRDQDGQATGILFENAVKLVEQVIPPASVGETALAIRQIQPRLWKMGLTGAHDFDKEICLEALRDLEQNQELGIRVQKSIPKAFLDQALERGLQTGSGSDWLWIGGVKDFADGALGPQTAALLAPYQGSDHSGMLLLSREELTDLGIKAARGGLALAIHAIGDLANRLVLDVYEGLRQDEARSGTAPLPHRIEHAQLIDPADVPRLVGLGVTASMQPIHALSDMETAEAHWGERSAFAYAPHQLLKLGTRVIFGSDAPVESPNPWPGIHAAVTRRRADGSPGPDGWHPEGRLTLAETLQAYTVQPALAAGKGDRLGKLAPGFLADLIALDQDPFTCHPEELKDIQPAGTMLNGQWVYRNF